VPRWLKIKGFTISLTNEVRLQKPKTAAEPVFEDAMRELEGIVHGMEGGALTLEQSLEAYQRGAVLIKQCQVALERVREQVRVLDGDELKPLDVPSDAHSGNDD